MSREVLHLTPSHLGPFSLFIVFSSSFLALSGALWQNALYDVAARTDGRDHATSFCWAFMEVEGTLLAW